MKKDNAVRNGYLVFFLLALFIVGYLAANVGINALEKGTAELMHYTQTGKVRVNLLPLRNLFALAVGGELGAALLMWLGWLVTELPLGIFLPILYSRFRTLPGVMGFSVAMRVLRISRVYMRGTGSTVLDIDSILLSLLGVFLGYLIWKRFIDGKIDVSRASMG